MELRYSPYHNNDFHDNDDPIDDIGNAEADNACTEPSNSIGATHYNNACDDEAITSSIEHNGGPWAVRRIDNIYTCHNEVLVDGRHQVRSRVISHIIVDKYIQEKKIYTPNDIRAYMLQE